MADFPSMLIQAFTDFIGDLRESIFANDVEYTIKLTLIETHLATCDKNELMSDVVENFIPYKEYIKKRDLDFFVKKKEVIFAGLNSYDVNNLSSMITERKISEENIKSIFAHLQVILGLSEAYKKKV